MLAKSLDHLHRLGYTEQRITGEVFLWGTVVEHEDGWRAQFAYPRTFIVPLSMVPRSMGKLESWPGSLATHVCDSFIDGEIGTVPLLLKGSGVDASGLDLLVRRSGEW